MNARERYVRSLLFLQPDRVPLEPGAPRESTLAAWHRQGLSADADYRSALLDALGVEPEPWQPRVSLGVDFRMVPWFEEKVLEHHPGSPGRPGSYVVQDWMGAITEISDEYDYTYIRTAKDFVTRRWHRFPVSTRADWLRMRERYDPTSPGRYPEDLAFRLECLEGRDYPLVVTVNGPFWQLREWLGLEGLCVAMIEQPAWVEEMIEYWTEFVLAVLRPIVNRLQIDALRIGEDMAYKAHSMISPAMARRFLLPTYRKWSSAVTAAGCPIVDVDSDGYVAELIPIWLDAGVNVCDPVEVAAGNDVVEYRRRFGTSLGYIGAIDKRAIARGGREMEAEVMRVVPPLLEAGGFIPGCDHGVPPDISWPTYVEYSRLLAKLTGSL